MNALVRAEAFQTLERDPKADPAYFHPGDTIGSLIGQLWKCGEKDFLASIVAEYMAQMRDHAPNRPEAGNRLTLEVFIASLREAINQDSLNLTNADIESIQDFLNREVPVRYSHNPDLIDEA